MKSRQMVEVRISGKPSFNFIVTPATTVGVIKAELRKKLKKDPDTLSVKFWINKKKALDVFGTKKYDKITLEKRWDEIVNPVVEVEVETKIAVKSLITPVIKDKSVTKTPPKPLPRGLAKPLTTTALPPLKSLQSKKFEKPKKYKIMGTGGVLYKVKYDGEKVYIKKLSFEVDTDEEEVEGKEKQKAKSKYVLVYTFPVKDVIVAVNSETQLPDGSSLLLHKTGLEYVFVGAHISKFTALAPIKKLYISNDRTWESYAVDEDSNVYLFDEGVIVKDVTPHLEPGEMIKYYYDNMIISGPEGEENRMKLSKQFRDIDRYYTEAQEEDLEDSQDSELELVNAEEKKKGTLDYYYRDGDTTYFRHVLEYKRNPERKAIVLDSNRKVTPFSEEDHKKLMKEYGKIHGFSFMDETLM